MTLVAFTLVIVLALAAGLLSRIGAKGSIGDFLVGGRSFGPFLIFILGAGEAYSIGTLLGFPGGVYANGANYGVWFIAYILLAYPIGYVIAPYLWRAGKLYDSMTLPDVVRSHYRSPGLERVLALSSVIFLIPWGQLQLSGLEVAMQALGISISPTVAVFSGAALAVLFLMLSGVRAPAFVSYVKDLALLLGALIIGLAAIHHLGGTANVFEAASDAGATHDTHISIGGTSLSFIITTTLFQMVGFFIFPFIAQAIFSSRSESTLKKVARFNPLYMLMYPFLVAAAFAAQALLPKKLEGPDSNQALLQLSHVVLPDFLTGLVAGGAALCAIVVLCGSALGIGGIVSRNLLPSRDERSQKITVRTVIVGYMVISLILTMVAPKLLLALVNTAYYGITQAAVIFGALIFGWRIKPIALAVGLVVGDLVVLGLYLLPESAPSMWLAEHGINIGLAALVVNILITVVWRFAAPATDTPRSMRSYTPREVLDIAKQNTTAAAKPPADEPTDDAATSGAAR